ncbi:TetR/AcrR family transcriptional regulator [Plantactinospora siamensis]|uniref:TetR/AcrR family transcriptional regulator n=1 Tax=Plantactinospora siamensis TaxID=555372 RepID=A0ABV6P4A4_9ACTN
MSPRSSAREAARTRARIVRAAVDRASTLGLAGVTVRDLAVDLGMSKSGVVAPFASRGRLLETAFDSAVATFRAVVVEPALALPPGRDRLLALLDDWVDYLVDCPFPGGCFLTTASVELDNQAGPLRERTVAAVTRWLAFLADEAHAARPDLPADRARDLATTINGIAMSANQEIQLLADPAAGPRARRAMHAAVAAFAPEPAGTARARADRAGATRERPARPGGTA